MARQRAKQIRYSMVGGGLRMEVRVQKMVTPEQFDRWRPTSRFLAVTAQEIRARWVTQRKGSDGSRYRYDHKDSGAMWESLGVTIGAGKHGERAVATFRGVAANVRNKDKAFWGSNRVGESILMMSELETRALVSGATLTLAEAAGGADTNFLIKLPGGNGKMIAQIKRAGEEA